MTAHDEIPVGEDYLAEAQWALAKADGLTDPLHPGRPLLVQQAHAYAAVSLAQTARLSELRQIVEGNVWAHLTEPERLGVMDSIRALLPVDSSGSGE